MSWWESIEFLGRVNTIIRYAGVTFAILAALATAVSILFSNRLADLQGQAQRHMAERVQEAEQALESTARELKETKRRLQPRALTAAQRAAFLGALQGSPRGPVTVVSVLGDSEAYGFAQALLALLQQAMWEVSGVDQAVFSGRPTGLVVKVRSEKSPPVHAAGLQRALGAAGFNVPRVVDPARPEGIVELVVGHKP